MKPAKAEDAGLARQLQADRKTGYTWNRYRGGIVFRAPKTAKRGGRTSIWYGNRIVTWDMWRTMHDLAEGQDDGEAE